MGANEEGREVGADGEIAYSELNRIAAESILHRDRGTTRLESGGGNGSRRVQIMVTANTSTATSKGNDTRND